MYSAYNPNPMGARVGDCTVRAISRATGEGWDTVYCGLCVEGLRLCDMPTANHVWGAYLRRLALCHRRGRFFFYFVVGRAPKEIIKRYTKYIGKFAKCVNVRLCSIRFPFINRYIRYPAHFADLFLCIAVFLPQLFNPISYHVTLRTNYTAKTIIIK